jgi:hypothetical protein
MLQHPTNRGTQHALVVFAEQLEYMDLIGALVKSCCFHQGSNHNHTPQAAVIAQQGCMPLPNRKSRRKVHHIMYHKPLLIHTSSSLSVCAATIKTLKTGRVSNRILVEPEKCVGACSKGCYAFRSSCQAEWNEPFANVSSNSAQQVPGCLVWVT